MSTYKNGNYIVSIKNDGTKIYTALRRGEDFNPEFPDSIDIKLTNRCSRGCPYCHESSSSDGKHGDLERLKAILQKLPPYPIELSFGGGNILEMSSLDLLMFFKWCKERDHRIGITLNFSDFLCFYRNPSYTWIELVDAVGVSLDSSTITKFNKGRNKIEEINTLQTQWYGKTNESIPIVYHLILGTFPITFLKEFITNSRLSPTGNWYGPGTEYKTKRILFLGYKSKGRGSKVKDLYYPTEEYLKDLKDLIFLGEGADKLTTEEVIFSFDNLAIQQLNLRSSFTTEDWEKVYQGDDFTHSMYIDLPGQCYGPSSTSETRVNFNDPVYGDNIIKYFQNERNN